MPAAITPGLPDLSSDYPVSDTQVKEYQANGHVLLRGVCSPEEIAPWRKALYDTTFAHAPTMPPMEKRETYGKAFIQVGNLWEHNPAIAGFSLARRFGKVAARLMGVRGVRMYHDQALYKEAGGGPTPWHQDQYYWPLASEKSITLWMPLVDISAYMGALTFASGSHKQGQVSDLAISDESQAFFQKLVKDKGYKVVNMGDMRAGDCTFHSGWTLHSAPANRSDKVREVMTIIYIDMDMRISTPNYPARQVDLDRWFPGKKPGDLADSAINPIIYQD